MTREYKILITAYDYRPHIGGVATCAYEATKALSKIKGLKIKLITYAQPGDKEFDRHGLFETKRVKMSRKTYRAAHQLTTVLKNEINQWNPDCILSFLWLPSAVSSFFSGARRKKNIPYMTVVHGVELLETKTTFKKRLRSWFAPLKRKVLKNSASVFAVSHFTANLVYKILGKEAGNVKVIFNGVNTSEFYPEPKKQVLIDKFNLEDKTVFLSMSRLEDYKGVDRALEAFSKVKAKNKNFKYLICGEGSDGPRIKKLIAQYNLEDVAVLVGNIPFESRRDYYNLSDCFVLLSRFDKTTPNVEGFGLVFLEAAACGKPSIAGNSGGISDAVIDGVTGWLVDPENVDKIENVILECLDDSKKVQQLGKSAFKRAANEMSWDKVAKIIFDEVVKHVRN